MKLLWFQDSITEQGLAHNKCSTNNSHYHHPQSWRYWNWSKICSLSSKEKKRKRLGSIWNLASTRKGLMPRHESLTGKQHPLCQCFPKPQFKTLSESLPRKVVEQMSKELNEWMNEWMPTLPLLWPPWCGCCRARWVVRIPNLSLPSLERPDFPGALQKLPSIGPSLQIMTAKTLASLQNTHSPS